MDLTPVGDPRIYSELAQRVAARRPVAPPPEVVPPPEIPARPATDVEIASCRSASSLIRKATALGWSHLAWFARGPFLGSSGQVLGMADSLLVRFYWGDVFVEAAAHWERRDGKGWAYDAGAIKGGPQLGSLDLAHWLAGTAPAERKVKAA